MKFQLVLVIALFSTLTFAVKYPVDDEIEGLRLKANYLESMKNTFEVNTCFIEVGKTRVPLVAAALRSEGLVMAVGDAFAGNYLAYHKAPQPEKLEGVIDMTFLKNGMGKDAKIITARLGFDEKTGKPNQLTVIVNHPYQEPSSPELWFYAKGAVKLPISLELKVHSEARGVTQFTKLPFVAGCN